MSSLFLSKIFVESLLCSGRLANIQLAGKMVQTSSHQRHDHLHQASTDSPEGAPVWKVPYDGAVELVLMAAQEYFDSSANLTDSSMDLARSVIFVFVYNLDYIFIKTLFFILFHD